MCFWIALGRTAFTAEAAAALDTGAIYCFHSFGNLSFCFASAIQKREEGESSRIIRASSYEEERLVKSRAQKKRERQFFYLCLALCLSSEFRCNS